MLQRTFIDKTVDNIYIEQVKGEREGRYTKCVVIELFVLILVDD